ncbi:MAG TPA: Arc family DNA-binding protein [Propionibacteriaceae bacterium]|nr:Arc family DNA-binding protein [Propionibacteriaceae bacterium]
MSMLTVRDLDPEVKEKLRRRAARHGRSMEAEARLILAAAVEAEDEPVDLVASIRENFSGTGIELDLPDRTSGVQRPIAFDS